MPYLLIYLAGAAIGLAVMRDPWPSRLALAAVWPLGPLAFAVVVALLLVVAAVLWPLPVLGAAGVLGLGAWLLIG
ncbi:MAG: hypothetical protein ACT4QD_15505 [Acidobacteriota bacterium]